MSSLELHLPLDDGTEEHVIVSSLEEVEELLEKIKEVYIEVSNVIQFLEDIEDLVYISNPFPSRYSGCDSKFCLDIQIHSVFQLKRYKSLYQTIKLKLNNAYSKINEYKKEMSV